MKLASIWRATQQRCRQCGVHAGTRFLVARRGMGSLTSKTRNIGIIAHIDAGKTTTTERMLFYGGHTRRIGNVDEGSTVTDFLPAERARGITIQSAAVTFNWPPKAQDAQYADGTTHRINLIDTPGHADFTFEVLRSLRVLDGAVCILDGVAGVEAQTEKVWAQATHYSIPRIAFVNKLDRDGAAFARTVVEIAVRLRGWPAVCQIPWLSPERSTFTGIGDVVALRGLRWSEGSNGIHFDTFSHEQLATEDKAFGKELAKARIALVELLSEHDDELVEDFLSHDENHLAIPASSILAALRRCLQRPEQAVIPVLAGASFRNIGVQPLLDAVVQLLPSPEERPSPEISVARRTTNLDALLRGEVKQQLDQPRTRSPKKQAKGDTYNPASLEACALAFKVVHDPKRGILVYVRVYHGSIARGVSLYNSTLGVTEKPTRLYHMYANEAVEVSSIDVGQIGVIPGLRHTRTGDTMLVYSGVKGARAPPPPIDSLQLRPIEVPPPVFFASIEPESLSAEKHLNECLDLLLREDPSLNVTTDSESGQIHLAGMGELHLEIARDRLLSDFKAKATMGQIEISYREALTAGSDSVTEALDRDIAGKRARATSVVEVHPLQNQDISSDNAIQIVSSFDLSDNNVLIIEHPQDLGEDLPSGLTLTSYLSAVRTGVNAALCRGPTHRFPVHSALITLRLDPATHLFPDSSTTAVSMATRIAVQRALRASATKEGTTLMEPVMLVSISVNEEDMGAVMHDLSAARGAQVLSLDHASRLADGVNDASAVDSLVSSQADDRVIDLKKVYVPPDPFGSSPSGSRTGTGDLVAPTRQRKILARVPLKEMVGYLKYLRSLTKGRGTFTMKVDAFERMGPQRLKAVLKELRGEMD